MPDPTLFAKAIALAAAASAMVVLISGCVRRPASAARLNAASILAMLSGLVLGAHVLELVPHWPPENALERFLAIVVPAVVGIEFVAAFARFPPRLAWLLRISLAALTTRIVLHGSTYLADAQGQTTVWQVWTLPALGGALLAAVWGSLAWLSRRSPGVSLPLVLSQTCLCGGLTVMLSAYLSGGEAALPFAAVLGGVGVASRLMAARDTGLGAIGIGIVGLFGVLVLGRFFGELATGRALAVFLAPLACWVTELPALRSRKPWQVGTIRVALAAVPLLAVLFLAKRDFDRDMQAGPGYETANAVTMRFQP